MLIEAPHSTLASPGGPREVIESCARETRPVWIRYEGGSNPGSGRLILPAWRRSPAGDSATFPAWRRSPAGDSATFPAWCDWRQACRTFRFDRIAAFIAPSTDQWDSFPFFRALSELESYALKPAKPPYE